MHSYISNDSGALIAIIVLKRYYDNYTRHYYNIVRKSFDLRWNSTKKSTVCAGINNPIIIDGRRSIEMSH